MANNFKAKKVDPSNIVYCIIAEFYIQKSSKNCIDHAKMKNK